MSVQKLALKPKIIYAIGNLGIGIITVLHILYIVYFFLPPLDAGIPYLIPQSKLMLGLTYVGLIIFVGKLIDAFLDPFIAQLSNKIKHKRGRRIPLMRFAALPFALSFALVFLVPDSSQISMLNVMWLAGFIVLGAVFYTSYMIPFYSLLVDMAKTSDDKVDLGTASGAFWFLGFILVAFAPSIWTAIHQTTSFSKIESMQVTFFIFAFLGFVFLMIPAYFIDGEKYENANNNKNNHAVIAGLRRVLRNRSFKFYLLSNTCYTVATILFESGLIYFITVLALLEAEVQGPIITLIGVLTLLCYPLVNKLSKTRGKSFVLKLSLLLFALTFLLIATLGIDGINIYFLLAMIILLTPLAQASFSILPHVLTADCAEYERYKTGDENAAMYIAANSFCIKLGFAIGFLLFTSLLLLGKDVGNDFGVRLASLSGAFFVCLGFVFLSQYNEDEILTYMHAMDEKNPG